MGTPKNRLNETVLLSTQNTCLNWSVRKYKQFYSQKWSTLTLCIFLLIYYRCFVIVDPSLKPDRSHRQDKKIDSVQFSNRKQFMQKKFWVSILIAYAQKVSLSAHVRVLHFALNYSSTTYILAFCALEQGELKCTCSPEPCWTINFTPSEELVPIHYFWQMWNLCTVNFDNFWV